MAIICQHTLEKIQISFGKRLGNCRVLRRISKAVLVSMYLHIHSDEASFDVLVNCQSLNFTIIGNWFSILSRITVSSIAGITLLVSLIKMSLLSSQDSQFLGWEMFLKIGVFLRLLFFISLTSSFITVTFSLQISDFSNWSV